MKTEYFLFTIIFLQNSIIPSFGDDSESTYRACVCEFKRFTQECCKETKGEYSDNKCKYHGKTPGTGYQSDFKDCCRDVAWEDGEKISGFDCFDVKDK